MKQFYLLSLALLAIFSCKKMEAIKPDEPNVPASSSRLENQNIDFVLYYDADTEDSADLAAMYPRAVELTDTWEPGIAQDVYNNLNADFEINVDELLRGDYRDEFKCVVYIPNFDRCDTSLTPIIAVGHGLADRWDEDVIAGWYADDLNDSNCVILSESEALEMSNPVWIVTVDDSDTTSQVVQAATSVDSVQVTQNRQGSYRHFFFSRYKIYARYENDNWSEYHAMYRTSKQSPLTISAFTRDYKVADIYKNSMGVMHTCWDPVYEMISYTDDFPNTGNYGEFGITYEYDWYQSKRSISVQIPYGGGTGVVFKFRATHSWEYYQIISNSVTDIPDGWYLSIPQKGDLWIHHWN